jgi:hypothetical protein
MLQKSAQALPTLDLAGWRTEDARMIFAGIREWYVAESLIGTVLARMGDELWTKYGG